MSDTIKMRCEGILEFGAIYEQAKSIYFVVTWLLCYLVTLESCKSMSCKEISDFVKGHSFSLQTPFLKQSQSFPFDAKL